MLLSDDKEPYDVEFLVRNYVSDDEIDEWAVIQHTETYHQNWLLKAKKNVYVYSIALN